MSVPIIFGWLIFSRNIQVGMGGYKPILAVHWVKADWMKCSTYARRLLLIYGVSP